MRLRGSGNVHSNCNPIGRAFVASFPDPASFAQALWLHTSDCALVAGDVPWETLQFLHVHIEDLLHSVKVLLVLRLPVSCGQSSRLASAAPSSLPRRLRSRLPILAQPFHFCLDLRHSPLVRVHVYEGMVGHRLIYQLVRVLAPHVILFAAATLHDCHHLIESPLK